MNFSHHFRDLGEPTPIRTTLLLTSMMVLAGIVGCLAVMTSGTLLSFLTTKVGLIISMVAINVIPIITVWTHQNCKGVTAQVMLAVDGFISGAVVGPIVWYAETLQPGLAILALGITVVAFCSIAALVLVFGHKLDLKQVNGICCIIAMVALGSWVLALFVPELNGFLLFVIAGLAVTQVVVGVENVKRGYANEIEGACILFASFFNLFIVIINWLIQLAMSSND